MINQPLKLSRTENTELMAQARRALQGKWFLAAAATLVCLVPGSLFSRQPEIQGLVSLLISGPMMLGMTVFVLAIAREETPAFSVIFSGFRRYLSALATHLLLTVFVILWSLLLIVPGIMAAFSYAMTFFILADDKTIEPLEAIIRSKQMMYGNRWKLLCLGVRFIGWALLALLTAGIGFLWLIPYMHVSFARFYEDLKAEAERFPEAVYPASATRELNPQALR